MNRARSLVEPARNWRLQRLGLVLFGGATAALTGFHLVLFVGRLRDLSILQPGVAVQWAGAALLLAFLAYLKGQGVSLLRGRSALAFWLLVLLLHVVPHVPAPAADGGSEVLLALPSVWMAVAIGLLRLVRSPRPVAPAAPPAVGRWREPPYRPLQAGFRSALFARPPPFPSR